MGLFSRWRNPLSSDRPDGIGDVFVDDPRFDAWEVVREFEDLSTARAWCQQLESNGMDAVVTVDHQPDRFGRGDFYLQVPSEQWSDAESYLSGLDD